MMFYVGVFCVCFSVDSRVFNVAFVYIINQSMYLFNNNIIYIYIFI